ncbi:flavoprotein [Bacillus sp. Marseille-Q1617]|uniref:flavoprotein n=1 Tax=Bacillus sp. Marseille-Q1617 TaxID=2736887 RepID=UPI00158F3BAC|nr:flavoprotein [Bacillus sp. Marseille-Q1617]
MTDGSFSEFLDAFLAAWKQSSIWEMEKCISADYQAREISGGEIADFGYQESINGWKQGFDFVKEKQAQWDVNEISIIPLRENEMLATFSATIVIHGNSMETVNLFFNTFKKFEGGDWKLVRSYIEAGVPIENVKKIYK